MKLRLRTLGLIPALTLAAASAHATKIIVPIGTAPFSPASLSLPGEPDFYIKTHNASFSKFSASFEASPVDKVNKTIIGFDYLYTFSTLFTGTASGSASTSSTPDVVLKKLIINNVTYVIAPPVTPDAGQSFSVGNIALIKNAPDKIEVFGTDDTSGGTFNGTVSFHAAAVPEPAIWASFLLGFTFMGLALRRKLSQELETA